MPSAAPTAALLIIGNEVLSGRTRDVNLQALGQALAPRGIRVVEARVVPDDAEAISRALGDLRRSVDYLFTSGGIGPTHDDITTETVAAHFGLTVEEHPEALALLLAQLGDAAKLNAARRKMAMIPKGAALVDNPVSRVPGFRIDNVFVMAGVPDIFAAMVDGVKDGLAGGPPMLSQTRQMKLREGDLATGLADVQKRFPLVEIGSYPYFRNDAHGVNVVLRSIDAAALAEATEAVEDLARELGVDAIAPDAP